MPTAGLHHYARISQLLLAEMPALATRSHIGVDLNDHRTVGMFGQSRLQHG